MSRFEAIMRCLRSYIDHMQGVAVVLVGGMLLVLLCSAPILAETPAAQPDASRLWSGLVAEAKALRLPTQFLEQVPKHFVTFEFEDLHAFAAEYHPADHRMVLDRSLSLNAAGRTLRPLGRLTHKELETLYHELFHVYMDFLEQEATPSEAHASLIAFAREQQHCRYQQVLITPVLQKRALKEERFLSETESWEVLNETWAVFIGWAVWTQLEVDQKPRRDSRGPAHTSGWIARLDQAEQDAALIGYYEPEDLEEKRMARKRFLAPEFRLSSPELLRLMKDVLGSQPDVIRQATQVLQRSRPVASTRGACAASTKP
ncbi:MAG TPA: hypothetical protein PKI24_16710 [Nitrospira sp.]|nr:hypothetical protein [Nitrospira sp.]HNP41244.1 hypothetical protein [Nitrospira sp.]